MVGHHPHELARQRAKVATHHMLLVPVSNASNLSYTDPFQFRSLHFGAASDMGLLLREEERAASRVAALLLINRTLYYFEHLLKFGKGSSPRS
jgi:hypothetical protein